MLSVLIAVYNIDVRELVRTLNEQCRSAEIDYEILCFDDHSENSFHYLNASLNDIAKVTYQRFDVNQGRVKLRNALGKAAKYPFLLFMDGDSRIIHDKYIQDYLSSLDEEKVLVGKTVYSKTPPPNPSAYLRWYYGIHREAIPAARRNEQPYQSFRTHHFIIPKHIFHRIEFSESISRYGHEDTLFGLQLSASKVDVLHLDIPLEHTGLDAANVFLEKSRNAVENLRQLSVSNPEIDSRLLRKYRLLHKLGMADLLGKGFPKIRLWLERKLCTSSPDLWMFDLYKLAYLCNITNDAE